MKRKREIVDDIIFDMIFFLPVLAAFAAMVLAIAAMIHNAQPV